MHGLKIARPAFCVGLRYRPCEKTVLGTEMRSPRRFVNNTSTKGVNRVEKVMPVMGCPEVFDEHGIHRRPTPPIVEQAQGGSVRGGRAADIGVIGYRGDKWRISHIWIMSSTSVVGLIDKHWARPAAVPVPQPPDLGCTICFALVECDARAAIITGVTFRAFQIRTYGGDAAYSDRNDGFGFHSSILSTLRQVLFCSPA
ncbi:hypothetical protein BC827DRAFT_1154408 [Russula dissimulans]|nr:hypothetical protein BC827DRAFT_1154408 [Russula dissimulans]